MSNYFIEWVEVIEAYVPSTESRRVRLTGKYKSEMIFQQFSNTYPADGLA
jgi:hypothetical protein